MVPLPEWNARAENCGAGEVEVETHDALAPAALVSGRRLRAGRGLSALAHLSDSRPPAGPIMTA